MFQNWKTTSAGLIMIIGSVATLIFTHPLTQAVIVAAATAILGGIGLIFAKDSGGTTPPAQ
jgi:hypothetical protein